MIDLEVAMYVLAAAVAAAAIRLYDTPKDVLMVDGAIRWEAIVPAVAGALIATPIGCWLLNISATVPSGFAEAVAIGVAGMAFVKAALGGLKP
jgi:hypothetical protein